MVGAVVDDPDSWIDRTADPAAMPICSCSAPSLVQRMLELLEAGPGYKVLELGTGTG
ncbi:hypothetical protein [Actinomadura miaoliensis]|uniref:Uncharacterized protein n=1 Tax=Actinomadura miaoliensis TaxID=430685 RepID=A0ABP7WJ08_9ACTN